VDVEASPHSQNPPSGGFGRGPTSSAFGPTDGPVQAPSRIGTFVIIAVAVMMLSTAVVFLLMTR
jgi:hypothetical protein